MDGRRMRWWILCGSLILAGTGCKRNTLPDQSLPPNPMVNNIAPPGLKKSFWGSSAKPQVPTPGMPAPEAIAEARPRKTGPMPDFEAAAADLKVELAFADPVPPNRDEMLDIARIRYQRALEADEKHKGALLGLARMHAKLGEQEQAIEAYRSYLKHYPKDADIHHEVAQRMGQWKNWDGAITWCDSALKIDPENRTYRKTQGFSLAMAGRWEEAFSTLCEIMPEAQARHNLAGLLDHLGHRDACRQQLEMALRADPGYEPSQQFLAELDGRLKPDTGIAEKSSEIQQAGGTMP
ncbi:MAG TPA: tetratricopeptide repeat protein [Fimbriiglobus sp.]|nr:tetratricopeptide repeat protein [Fimbriiglobus sp.]